MNFLLLVHGSDYCGFTCSVFTSHHSDIVVMCKKNKTKKNTKTHILAYLHFVCNITEAHEGLDRIQMCFDLEKKKKNFRGD